MVRKQEEKKAEEVRKGMRLGKYELGRTLGEGNFGKVKFAKDTVSGQSFAVKIIDKSRIADLNFSLQVCVFRSNRIFFILRIGYLFGEKMADGSKFLKLLFGFLQIKREIRTLKMVKHPNIVRLHEVRLRFS